MAPDTDGNVVLATTMKPGTPRSMNPSTELTAEQKTGQDILIGQEQLRAIDIQRYADNPTAMTTAEAERAKVLDEQLLEVLSESQWVKYQELPEAARAPKEPPSLRDRTQDLKTRLNLSDAQAAK
jgi:endonuclease/exonuclease/phosphatase (EEP) superfamily protein YafD